MKECTFCSINKSKDGIIYENKHFYSMFDVHPVSPGHALVISKRHVVSILDLNEKEWSFLQPAIRETIKIIEIRKTMRHRTLKGTVCGRRSFLGCSEKSEVAKQLLHPRRMQFNFSDITNFEGLYKIMKQKKFTPKSQWFCDKMLKHLGLHKKPDAYNIGNNDGEAAGRTVPHLHIQIIPRYKGDVEDPTGGIRHIIHGMGNYKK